jgi:RNA polymerase sigma-70 factor (ECF subfamily)
VTDENDEIERLAEAWKGGDRRAFEELIRLLHRRLRIHIAAFCDSRELVDEVLQQTFVTCFQRIGSFTQRGAFISWMTAIARNHLRHHWRERRHCARLTDDVAEQVIAESGLDDLERHEEAAARSRRLAGCLDRLPQRSRALIERRHLDQRPLAEMARQFKQSVESLSVALHRIRQLLRRCLESSP